MLPFVLEEYHVTVLSFLIDYREEELQFPFLFLYYSTKSIYLILFCQGALTIMFRLFSHQNIHDNMKKKARLPFSEQYFSICITCQPKDNFTKKNVRPTENSLFSKGQLPWLLRRNMERDASRFRYYTEQAAAANVY